MNWLANISTIIILAKMVLGGQNNSYLELESLQHIFDPPELDNPDYLFIDGRNIPHNITSNNSKVCILFTGSPGNTIPHEYFVFNLNLLLKNSNVEELWIYSAVQDGYYNDRLRIQTSDDIHHNTAGIKNLQLQSEIDFSPAIKQLLVSNRQSLEVLNFKNTFFSVFFDNIVPLINSTDFPNLIALSLSKVATREAFVILNMTDMFHSGRAIQLQYLSLSNNGIVALQGSFIHTLPNLRILDLSRNLLYTPYDNRMSMWEIFLLHQNLEIVNANYQNQQEWTSNNHLQFQNHNSRRKRSIEALLNDKVKLLIDCARKENLSTDQLVYKPNFCKVFRCMIKEMYLSESSYYSLDMIPCDAIPNLQDLLPNNSNKTNTQCPPFGIHLPFSRKLKEVDFISVGGTYLGTYYRSIEWDYITEITLCVAMNSIEKISFKSNHYVVRKEGPNLFNRYKIVGFDVLKYLDISGNYMLMKGFSTFASSFPTLTYLNLANNFIEFEKNDSLKEIFPSMESYDISYCNLTSVKIPPHLFTGASTLKYVNLAGNKIDKFQIDISETPQLISINMSSNLLSVFDMDSLEYLKRDANKQLYLDLSNNPLSCGCSEEEIKLMEMIQNYGKYNLIFNGGDLYICNYLGKYQLLRNIDLSEHIRNCKYPHLDTIISTVLSNVLVLLIIIISITSHRYRFRLFHFYLRLKHYLCRKAIPVENYQYDAFISYCEEDRFWVHSTLVKELENKYGFKLCIHYRDFMIGSKIADAIIEAIINSRITIVILSDNSIKSSWCRFELETAHCHCIRHDKTLLVIRLGEITNSNTLSPLVKMLLESKVYLSWPDVNYHVRSQSTAAHDEICHTQDTRSFLCLRGCKKNSKRQIIQDKKLLFWSKLCNIMYGEELNWCCFGKRIGYNELQSVSGGSGDRQVNTEVAEGEVDNNHFRLNDAAEISHNGNYNFV